MIIGKDQPITFQLDTGSSVNMIPASYVDAGKIRPYHKRLKMWNNDETRPKGTCRESVLNPRTGKRYFVEFIVFEEADCTPLLSLETCERMKLVTINDNEFDHVNTIRQWTTEFSDVFDNKPGTLPVSASSKEHDDFSQVNNLQWTPVKRERLTEIEKATDKDNVMMKLKARIITGWPEKLADLEPELKPYFSYRDELTLQDGLIVRGDRIVIPASMRLEVKRKVHAGHMGINSCIRRARDLVFWPGMSKEIHQYVEACDTCARYASTQQPETLHLHPVPNRPWSKVGIDLFSISGRDYLVPVDYMSNFYEVDYLPETTAATVITKIKYHFARHGIPDIVITDNGPQFACGLFRQFASTWEFDHQPISPGNSKANGAAEAAAKYAKKMMKRCIAEKTDPYLGLLNLRNTPTEGINTSPVQRLFGRRTKTVTPTSASRLQPRYDVSDEVAKKEEQRRSNAATQDRSRKDLRQMRPGEGIWIQPISGKTKEWTRGTVEERTSERAYDVRSNDNGRIYRRDRQRLRVDKTLCGQAATTAHSEKHDDSSPVVGTPNAEATPFPDATRTGSPVMQPRTTRSGRVVNTPVKLDI